MAISASLEARKTFSNLDELKSFLKSLEEELKVVVSIVDSETIRKASRRVKWVRETGNPELYYKYVVVYGCYKSGERESRSSGKRNQPSLMQNCPWRLLVNLQDENDMPALISDSENDESDREESENCLWEDVDDGDEEEMKILSGNVTCLFCSNVDSSVEAVLSHCKTKHHFDIPSLCQRWSVDCIGYIKMINFCRQEHPSSEQVIQGLMSGGTEWQGDNYMQASDPSDLMLQFDIESVMESLPMSNAKEGSSEWKDNLNSYMKDTHSSEVVMALTARVKAAEEQRDLLRGELERVLQDMEKLKLAGQQLVINTSGDEKQNCKTHKKDDTVNDEDGYFASYSHHGIHMTMLKDEIRTKSYHDFMIRNGHLFEGKTVLDVGCGTGILSMFAAKAGAKQVVAVDSSQIIYQAMDIARENNMHEKITFVKGRLEDVTLPVEKFDVIISEWMGYFLLFEAMLNSVLWARDRYLAPGGCVYPDYFTMKVVGVCDPELYDQTVGFWDDVYGFKMTCMKSPVLDEVQVCSVRGDRVITKSTVIKKIDVKTCKVNELDFHSEFSLVCVMDANLTAIVGYFDTYFNNNCHQKIHFSTGPKAAQTHWEQAVMVLPKSLPVKKDSKIACSITYRKDPHSERGIAINLSVGDLKLKYTLA